MSCAELARRRKLAFLEVARVACILFVILAHVAPLHIHTVYLPVFVPGALLELGDAHAIIGDGETAAAGLEVESLVTLRVRLLKGQPLPRPMIGSPSELKTCGWGMTMEAATSCAMRDMVDFLERKLAMPRAEAYNLAGLVGDARPRNAVCAPGPCASRCRRRS